MPFRLEICSKSTPKFSTTDPRISGMVARKLITVNDKGVEGNLQYESNLIQPIVNGDKEDQYCCL